MEGKVKIGKVTRLHGFKGELSLKLVPEYAALFEELDHIFLELDKKPTPFFIDALRFTAQGFALVFFEGVDNQAAAERIRGATIWIEEASIPDDFIDEDAMVNLIGYQVTDTKEGKLGEVQDVVEHPGNSFLVIARGDGDILIPFVDPIVEEVDHGKKHIRVTAPDGLVSLNLD